MANWDVTTAGGALEIDTTLLSVGVAKPLPIDSNHFITFYAGEGSDGYTEVLTVNTSTWAVTTASTRLEFDTVSGTYHSSLQIDSTHFINFYAGSGNDGYAEVYAVNTSTWAVTTASTRLEFDTVNGQHNSAIKIDTDHFINFFNGNGTDGFAQVFTVNTSTWAVTTAAASLEFDTQNGSQNSACKIDDNHFINFWLGGAATTDGRVQVFTVNTTTWAVTTAASLLQFDTDVGSLNNVYQIDSNHFINFWSGVDGDGFVQVFTVNTSTWAVTTAAASLEFDTNIYSNASYYAVSRIDTNHFLFVWPSTDTAADSFLDGFAQVFEVNTTTWAVTTSANSFECNTVGGQYAVISELIPDTTDKYLVVYAGEGQDGYAQVLDVELPTSGPATQDLIVPLTTNTSTIYNHTITPQPVTLTVPLTTNDNTFYAHTITPQAVTITAPLYTNDNTFYSHTISPQAVTLTVPYLENTSTIYAPTISFPTQTLIVPFLNDTPSGTGTTRTVFFDTEGEMYLLISSSLGILERQ